MVTRYSSQVTEEQSCNVSGSQDLCMTSSLHHQVFAAEAMLMIASILHLGRSGIPKKVGMKFGEKMAPKNLCQWCENEN